MIVSKRSKAQGATRLIHTAELNANQKYNSLNNTLNKTGFLFLSPRLPLSKNVSPFPPTMFQDFGLNQV